MASATTTGEQQGLQRAIAKALEKEARANGTYVDQNLPVTTVTYTARFGGTKKFIRTTNVLAFIAAVEDIQAHFPTVKVYLFETTVTR